MSYESFAKVHKRKMAMAFILAALQGLGLQPPPNARLDVTLEVQQEGESLPHLPC
jgi:hypothetical protein